MAKLKINCSTEGATIRYTTNGTDPTESSSVYTEPISITDSSTIKAKAYKNGWTSSEIATYSSSSSITIPTPQFSIQEGSILDNSDGLAITFKTLVLDNYLEFESLDCQAILSYSQDEGDFVTQESSMLFMSLDPDASALFNVSFEGTMTLVGDPFNGKPFLGSAALMYLISKENIKLKFTITCQGKSLETSVMTIEREFQKVPTPTLTLSRSNLTVNGTLGNIYNSFSYYYKISDFTESSEGTRITGSSFSFSSGGAHTVYVRGFDSSGVYTYSDAAIDSIEGYSGGSGGDGGDPSDGN